MTYVGHPLADVIPFEPNKDEARAQLRLPAGKLIVALLPGSRRSELHHMASAFVLAAHRFRQEVHDVHFVCPTATRATRDMFELALHQHQRTDLPLTLLFGHSHEALAAADLALVASGTATLETALFKTPMVIAYRQSALSWAIMRHMATCRTSACRTSWPARSWCPSCCRTRPRRRRWPARCSRCCATAPRASARSSASATSTSCCARIPPRKRPTPCSR